MLVDWANVGQKFTEPTFPINKYGRECGPIWIVGAGFEPATFFGL